jgi:hypothetical protein
VHGWLNEFIRATKGSGIIVVTLELPKVWITELQITNLLIGAHYSPKHLDYAIM